MDKVKIEKLDTTFGKGITRIENKLCFVDKALPNEECEIEIIKDKKNYSEAIVKNIIKSSPDRINPLCPYYFLCGGCSFLHLEYSKQLEYKKEKVKEIFKRFASIDINIDKIESGKEFNYRNKLTLHVKDSKIGLYKEETHEIVEIDKCLISNPKINELIERLKIFIKNNNNSIYEIIIKTTTLDQTMLIINGNCDKDKLIEDFKDLDSIYLDNNLIYKSNTILEKINDLYFEIYPQSFFQVNYDMMLKMYNKVIDYYKNNNSLKVLDLYCGTGTIGICISKYLKSVVGIESNIDAIMSAKKNKVRNNIGNIDFICGKVEDNIDKFSDIDSIVVDPPRSGLDKYTIDNIIKINPKSLIYISCDPVTLARDINILKEKYEIKKVELIDMFPNTYHVESFCILERK